METSDHLGPPGSDGILELKLSKDQTTRYARTIALPEVGVEGQERLCRGKVLIVGAGGLGSASAVYLAASGVGTIGIVDSDCVTLDNLQRQVLHRTADIGRLKTESARDTLNALNPEITVTVYPCRLTPENAMELIGRHDFTIDATDNFASKFLLADTCHFVSRPYSHAGVQGWSGQTITVLPGRTACCRCIFDAPQPERDPSLPPAGIIGVVPGILGSVQAAEAVKFLLGTGALLTDALLLFDALNTRFRRVAVRRNPACPLCGMEPSLFPVNRPRSSGKT